LQKGVDRTKGDINAAVDYLRKKGRCPAASRSRATRAKA